MNTILRTSTLCYSTLLGTAYRLRVGDVVLYFLKYIFDWK